MKLLSVDTSTEACSAALLIDNQVIERYRLAPREHSHLILGMIDELLAEASMSASDLDALAFGRGPGSFMGIRIAAGVVQGIAFANELPVVHVSTLRSLAQVAHEQTGQDRIITAIDARMGEIYWAAWRRENEGFVEMIEESVCPPEVLSVPADEAWAGAGTGWATYGEVLQASVGDRLTTVLAECYPTAASIARLAVPEVHAGNTVQASAAVPVYLRDKVAAKADPSKYAGV